MKQINLETRISNLENTIYVLKNKLIKDQILLDRTQTDIQIIKEYKDLKDKLNLIESEIESDDRKEFYNLSEFGFSRYKTNGVLCMSKNGSILTPKNSVWKNGQLHHMYDLHSDDNELIHVDVKDLYEEILSL